MGAFTTVSQDLIGLRTRRIKCDETKADCGQCVRGRRKCDGYREQARDGQQNNASVSLHPLNGLGIGQSLANTTSSERRSFDFFCRQTIPQLCGFFDSSFWDRFVLQASQHEPAILHAAVALGSVHEKFEAGTLATFSSSQFALEQYVKSIRRIYQPIRNSGKLGRDVALMACVLFICIEVRLPLFC